MINKDKSLVDSINNAPTTNEESENEALKKQQASSAPPSNPLQAQMQGLGEHAAKMAGTPAARQGQLNAQEERLQQASQQADAMVNPQGQTVEDYYRTQDIQAQTLGRAQEEANKFEEEMKSLGSRAGNVGKYIMEATYKNLEDAQKEPYIEQVLKDDNVQEEFIKSLGVKATDLDSEQKEQMDIFISGLLDGKDPEELNLKELQESLNAEEQEFQNLVSEIQKKTYETIQNIGEDIANGLIDPEDVKIRQLMEAELITEADIRDSLGLFNGEPLPDNWEEMSYSEIQGIAKQNFQEQAAQLDQLAVMEGANFDAGRAYDRAAQRAEASEEMGQTVQFGDQLVSMEDFLSDERVAQEASRLLDANLDLEGEELDEELRRIYGDKFESREDYYRQLAATVKANKDKAQTIDDDIETTNEAIQEVQQGLREIGIEGIEDILGINLNTWDLEAGGLTSVYQEEALKFLEDYRDEMRAIHDFDPNFLASAKKRDDETWEEYGLRLDEKLASIEGWDEDTEKNVRLFNESFDDDGNFIGNADDFLEAYVGMTKEELAQNITWARFGDTKAKALVDSLPDFLKDGVLSKEEIENLGEGYHNKINLDDFADGNFAERINKFEGQGSTNDWKGVIDNLNIDDQGKLARSLKDIPEEHQEYAYSMLSPQLKWSYASSLEPAVREKIARSSANSVYKGVWYPELSGAVTNPENNELALAIKLQMNGTPAQREKVLRYLKTYKNMYKNSVQNPANKKEEKVNPENIVANPESLIINTNIPSGGSSDGKTKVDKWNTFMAKLGIPWNQREFFLDEPEPYVAPKVPTRELTPTEIASVQNGSVALPFSILP